ncbi:MAG: poly-beta,6-N-acetyl-D-glucosamine synthase [Clostridia bacterium]|nr:poly-beta,6-N-acetyl-D-glucosamine synthase [Clostridia bacterium]MDN5366169.1 poly-beta,6-N-acetyl-D-glucosamine synthase [Thermacetogenium sp.]
MRQKRLPPSTSTELSGVMSEFERKETEARLQTLEKEVEDYRQKLYQCFYSYEREAKCLLDRFYSLVRRHVDALENEVISLPVTVVLPCRNQASSIEGSCRALRYLDYLDYRVVFIDYASTVGTADVIRQWVKRVPIFYLL